nr:hypothetical protein [uncultured Flavobacterium sp.]
MKTNLFTADGILNIKVDFAKYSNEINALLQLREGMILLYNNIKQKELAIAEKNKGAQVSFFGRNPDIPENLFKLLPCFFHWFGNSLCNYARLVGYIVAREKNNINETDIQLEPNRIAIKNACDTYVNNLPEIQEVLKWRNKVSAHFALTDPRRDDNISTMEASIIYPVSFEIDRFKTGVWVLSKGNGNSNHTSEIPIWSLTQVFEILANRFWNDLVFNK